MHFRVGRIHGRLWVGCNTQRHTHIHTHTCTHAHTQLTLYIWRWCGSERLKALTTTTTITTQHRAFATRPPPPPSSDRSQDPRPGNSGIITPSQAPREAFSSLGLLGSGRDLPNNQGKDEEEKKPEDWNDILNRWYRQYEDFIGIRELKNAQDRVTQLSDGLLEAQGERRRLQAEMEALQGQLVENQQCISKTEQYSQEHMQLFSEARHLNERLRQVKAEFAEYEWRERETFTHLSSAIRDCHEQERLHSEHRKYWSIIASVVSAALASVVTSVSNWVRVRKIKEHITASHLTLLQGYEQMQADILTSLNSAASPAHLHAPTNSQNVPTDTQNAPTDTHAVEKTTQELQAFSADIQQSLETLADNVVSRLQSMLIGTTGEESSLRQPLSPSMSPGVATGGGEVSYARVAGAMIVGAGLGTLVTAFFLGALGGSAS